MKRGEVLVKLVAILDFLALAKESSTSEHTIAEAEYVLKELEAMGMKPQSYEGLMATGKKYSKATDFARDTMLINTWEPEDV